MQKHDQISNNLDTSDVSDKINNLLKVVTLCHIDKLSK